MSEFSQTERHPVFPVFLLVDVSYSMAGAPIQAVNAALPALKGMIQEEPQVGEIARIGIITFSDISKSVMPLCDIADAQMPILSPESGTNFAGAFRLARSTIETEIRSLGRGTRFYKPVVFFMSDGEHIASEDWRGPLRELTDKSWSFNPEVVAFGFGEANDDALAQIATAYAFSAHSGDPAMQVKEIMSALTASIRTTSKSFSGPQGGGLSVEVNQNTFKPLPIQEI